MRRLIAVSTTLALVLATLALSRHLLLATITEDAVYTASADHALAVPVIDLGDGWQTTLQIQNTGDMPTSVRIQFFGAAGTECSATREPLAVQCLGPIPAGAMRSLDLAADPTLAEVRSAVVDSVQPEGAGCSSTPGEPVAILVRRTRLSNGEEPHLVSSTYVGIAPAVAGFWEADQKAYTTVIPWVEISGTKQTTLYLQNVGRECADEVELELISGPTACLPAPRPLPSIPLGRSLAVDLAEVFENGTGGSAWIRSPQPLAVVVDRWLNDGTMLSAHATGRTASHDAVDAPLVLRGSNDWDTRLWSQNASTRFTALVEMAFRTSEITPTLESEHVVCPGGSTSVDTATITDLASPFAGTVALRSVGSDPDQPEIPPLAADIDLLSAGGGAAYHAPNRITDTVAAPDVALPWLTRAYQPVTATLSLTYTSRIAVVNQSEIGEGFVTLTFYDPDGSHTTYQPEDALAPRAMRLIDLADVPELPAGWHGSAILQFLSTDPSAGVGVAVLEIGSGLPGDTTTAYAGIVTRVQTQPTPTPSPAPAATPTSTPTPPATVTPTPSLTKTHLPLIIR